MSNRWVLTIAAMAILGGCAPLDYEDGAEEEGIETEEGAEGGGNENQTYELSAKQKERVANVDRDLDVLGHHIDMVSETYPGVEVGSDLFIELLIDALAGEEQGSLGTLRQPARTYSGRCVTDQEFWLLVANPRNFNPTLAAANGAEAEARRVFGAALHNTRGDAFRHAYWNILLAQNVSLAWANQFTTAHESEPYNGCTPRNTPAERVQADKERAMDLYNNAVGRWVFQSPNPGPGPLSFSGRLQRLVYDLRPDPRGIGLPACLHAPGSPAACTFPLIYMVR